MAERRHTEYDAELGWVSVPGHAVPDIYGPGRSITINRQSFRNKREFPERAPAGKLRVICSGDSFTLGYGVDDDATWSETSNGLRARLFTRLSHISNGTGIVVTQLELGNLRAIFPPSQRPIAPHAAR